MSPVAPLTGTFVVYMMYLPSVLTATVSRYDPVDSDFVPPAAVHTESGPTLVFVDIPGEAKTVFATTPATPSCVSKVRISLGLPPATATAETVVVLPTVSK